MGLGDGGGGDTAAAVGEKEGQSETGWCQVY